MHAGFFDVFHHACHEDILAIADHINVHLVGILQITIDEQGRFTGNDDGFAQIALQAFAIAHDLHRSSAQHIGRTQNQRKAEDFERRHRFFFRMRDFVGRLFQIQLVEERLETLAVFGKVNGIR